MASNHKIVNILVSSYVHGVLSLATYLLLKIYAACFDEVNGARRDIKTQNCTMHLMELSMKQ